MYYYLLFEFIYIWLNYVSCKVRVMLLTNTNLTLLTHYLYLNHLHAPQEIKRH